ncbi:lipase family protein [Pseudarthrobacter raffinosi]|uniref:lipase family protein n=1 Tax=Pseudarthrobacter raffinosi TaxID=2953651 RepID=UPI00208EB2EA|nr:lipase family protein [Pseudarthrobacter sp. MDT3-9]MCO4251956.1 lipase family protein [Pseudarthrobacter sp. MDT3-9]
MQSIASSGFLNTAQLTVSGQKLSSLLELPELKTVIAAQKIGNGRASQVPVLLSHSVLDDVIPYDQGRQLAKRWCAAGSSVYFDVTAGATHIGGYAAAIPQAFIFLERRFSNRSAVSNCWLYG